MNISPSYLSSPHTVVISDESRAELAWHGSPVLTYEIVGLPDVVVPHGHLQGLFGEVCIFYVVTELLQKIEMQKMSSSSSLQCDHIKLDISSFQSIAKYKS